MQTPIFTVLTSCYNSELLIDRVYNSLINQTFKSFEWIVIDDCSTDNTKDILSKIKQENRLNIKIYYNNKNSGPTVNYNFGQNIAQGKYIYYADHDDEIPNNALELLYNYWKEFDNDGISSVSGMCATPNGIKLGKELPSNPYISDYFKVYYEMGLDSERLFCYKKSVAMEFPFNFDKYGMQAGMLHHGPPALKYKTIFINDVIKIYYPNVAGSMTKQGRKKYSFGVYNNYVFWVNEAKKRINGRVVLKLRWHFAQVLYGLIANQPISKIVSDIHSISNKSLSVFFLPFAYLVYFYLLFFRRL